MIAALLAAQIVSSFPPLPPAEAAAVLARLESPANFATRPACDDCDGPHVFILYGSATDGPFGPLAPAYGAYRFGPIHPKAWNRIGRYPSTTRAASFGVIASAPFNRRTSTSHTSEAAVVGGRSASSISRSNWSPAGAPAARTTRARDGGLR